MPKRSYYKKGEVVKGVKKMLPKKGTKGGKSYKSSKGGRSTYKKSPAKRVMKRGVKGGRALMRKVQEVPKKEAPMLAAAAGAVVGATMGGLAGAMLSNHNTRKALGERLGELMKTARENIKVLNDHREEIVNSAREIAASAKKVQKKLKK